MDDLARDARAIFDAAVAGVQPAALLADLDLSTLVDRPLAAYRHVTLVGAGKASMAMAGVLEEKVGGKLTGGLVVVPHGYRTTLSEGQRPPQRVAVAESGHPVPDAKGLRLATMVLALARRYGPDDLLLVALSGGGSALWPAFAEGISLEEAQQTFRLLLHSGADIHAVNTVRRQLSRIGGGGLAVAARPASVLALVVSDVVGDDLATIASGPTVPDPTSRADARAVLDRFGLTGRVPESVRAYLDQPEPDAPTLDEGRVQTVLVGSNRDALAAARVEAERRGYAVRLGAPVAGEAREVGRRLAADALAVDAAQPVCLLWGGETTVAVTGGGRGGRNQELALAAALALDGTGRDLVFLSAGTDGIDGPTDAAGAWATPETVRRARALGLDAGAHLDANDAYPFWDALGGLVCTGPTHTNAMDVQVALVRPS